MSAEGTDEAALIPHPYRFRVFLACTLLSGAGLLLGALFTFEVLTLFACTAKAVSCWSKLWLDAAIAASYLGAWGSYFAMAVAWFRGRFLSRLVPVACWGFVMLWFTLMGRGHADFIALFVVWGVAWTLPVFLLAIYLSWFHLTQLVSSTR